ncbi:OLC1v1030833C1 [Oldenlandia corymbosa var. corymbosa]|uniref:OLC1v1030833C1 n=1 Tax=Oldenlandia corymbosa var. corymbosa TaxID=529605 RepID=A0AAV1CI26_OLDCO|nr:OLC1v1030833C1 [Oldenlandia corymbosa var. corymbosa]
MRSKVFPGHPPESATFMPWNFGGESNPCEQFLQDLIDVCNECIDCFNKIHEEEEDYLFSGGADCIRHVTFEVGTGLNLPVVPRNSKSFEPSMCGVIEGARLLPEG